MGRCSGEKEGIYKTAVGWTQRTKRYKNITDDSRSLQVCYLSEKKQKQQWNPSTSDKAEEKPEWADAAEKKKEFIKQQLEELNTMKGTETCLKIIDLLVSKF